MIEDSDEIEYGVCYDLISYTDESTQPSCDIAYCVEWCNWISEWWYNDNPVVIHGILKTDWVNCFYYSYSMN